MDRSARPDDGSPARLIATMVGIVGILLLGSLAWSAVGALFNALGSVTSSITVGRPTPISLVAVVGTPTSIGAVIAPATAQLPTSAPTREAAAGPTDPAPAAQQVTPTPPPEPTPGLTPTPATTGRAPWILLPQPPPDTRVPPGPLTIEARGRGESPISAIRLELDGAALPVSLEQRSESTWRGFATAQISAGKHTVRATVIDDQNRTGGFKWTFDAGP